MITKIIRILIGIFIPVLFFSQCTEQRNGIHITFLDSNYHELKDTSGYAFYRIARYKDNSIDSLYPVRIFFRNGNRHIDGYISEKDSVKYIGYFEKYNIKGKLEAEFLYHNGIPTGNEFTYENDTLIDKRYLIGGIPIQIQSYYMNGTLKFFYQLSTESEGNNTYTKSLSKHFYESGQTKLVYREKSFKLDGETLEYYPNGKLKEKAIYVQGEYSGKRLRYYENGRTELSENYLAGKLHGRNTYYFTSGKKSKDIEYFHGKIIKYKDFFEHGHLRTSTNLVSGIKNPNAEKFGDYYINGDFLEYNVNNTIRVKARFTKGLANGRYIKNDTLGRPLMRANSIIIKGQFYEKSVYHGDYKEYANGKLVKICRYSEGLKVGKYIENYPTGKRKKVCHYRSYGNSKGELDGSFKSYFANGKIHEEGSYSYGDKIGDWKEYDTYGNYNHIYHFHYRVGAICNDGTRSSATGRGACSHHGGVNYWLYEKGTRVIHKGIRPNYGKFNFN